MTKTLVFVVCSLLIACSIARADGPSVKSLPPSVIRTVPECGDLGVDATATTQVEVTFSKEMADNSYSWVQASSETFPQIVGKPRFLADKRTCVVNIRLQPKKTYVIWVNSEKFRNFKDADGESAVPYLLVFQTK